MSTRIYEIQHALEDILRKIPEENLLTAHDIIYNIYKYLNRTHFEERKEVDVKALTKTMEELNEICMEILYHTYKRHDLFISPSSQPSQPPQPSNPTKFDS
jgi:hypothetical protein